MAFFHAAKIVEVRFEIDRIDPHIEFLRRLTGCVHELCPVIAGLRNRRLKSEGGIEDTEASVSKAATRRIEVGEGGHDWRSPRTGHPILCRNELQVADFLAKPIIRHRFDFEDRLQVSRIRDLFKEADRRKSAWDDPVAGLPLYSAGGDCH